MDFTYLGYERMLEKIAQKGYAFCSYSDYQPHSKACILRHDVDFDLEKAVSFAKREVKMAPGSSATYFVLLDTEFYNLCASENRRRLEQLQLLGCKVGLHYDAPPDSPADARMVEQILEQVELLTKLAGQKIEAVSFHRPYRELLQADLQIPGIVNTYSDVFFHSFKYYSDSRMRWKENILQDVDQQRFEHMQVLIHPFWYEEEKESMEDKLKRFASRASLERYDLLNCNFTDLASVLSRDHFER